VPITRNKSWISERTELPPQPCRRQESQKRHRPSGGIRGKSISCPSGPPVWVLHAILQGRYPPQAVRRLHRHLLEGSRFHLFLNFVRAVARMVSIPFSLRPVSAAISRELRRSQYRQSRTML